MATYLYRTFSTATNRRIWTWSAWVKRQNLVSDHQNAMFGAYYDGSNRSVIRFHGHVLEFQDVANSVQIKTNRLFRDMNAWYHIVARVDTTQGTASDRVRLYVNGEQQTSFSQADYPSQNLDMEFQGSVVHYINARRSSAVDSIADMSYSHVHFADGQSLAPTVFGSTDSTTGEWKINTNPSFTLGTNGFTILKDGNTYTDQSSNSNNWTLAGSTGLITKTEDCPSNVFATWNPLQNYWESSSFSDGNTTIYTGSSQYGCNKTTIGASSGKYYWEVKIGASDGAGNIWQAVGINGQDITASNQELGKYNYQIGYYGQDGTIRKNSSNIDTEATYTTNDIIGVAMDLDNNKLYFHKNGTYINSGNPSTGVYGYDITTNPPLGAYFPSVGDWDNNNRFYFYANFGNGYFGTTAVSSAGTNASGNGIFEYDVPTGFTALSTKGLNL